MKSIKGNYIEIEESVGYAKEPSPRTYSENLPDTRISENPVELQKVIYTTQGKGNRQTFSHGMQTTISFRSDTPPMEKLHRHDYFELLFVVSEHLEIQIESELLQFYRGDVCILDRSTYHAEHYELGTELFYLVLTPEYLKSYPQGEAPTMPQKLWKFFSRALRDQLLNNKDYVAFRWKGDGTPLPLCKVMEELRREFTDKGPGYPMFVRGQICRLFAILSDDQYYVTEFRNLSTDEGYSLAFAAKQVLDKAEGQMNKQQLSKQLNYSAEHINQMFLRHYGCTVSSYNRKICLRHAANLLQDTSLPVHEISRQLGFVNRTNFYRLFEREYGCTPAEYRRKSKF